MKMERKIKFCVKLQDSVTEIFNRLIQVYKGQFLSSAQIFVSDTKHFWLGKRLPKFNSVFVDWSLHEERKI